MADLKFPYLKGLQTNNPEGIIKRLVSSGTKFPIDKINWTEHPYKPKVVVYAGYNYKYLWLNFMVKEDYIRAEGKKDQDTVYQDACVEFFVKVGDNYRNFEFNCIGACLSAIGPDRYSRTRLDADNLARIIRYPSLTPEDIPAEGSQCDWALTVGIPLDIIDLEAGGKFRCNFYKCGDKTKIPHYVTWSPINIPAPDFHRPEYFGEIELEERL
jgi:hypothetical protein